MSAPITMHVEASGQVPPPGEPLPVPPPPPPEPQPEPGWGRASQPLR
jgi:hypothetical protein